MILELLLMLTPIDGTKYNTRALQQANFANIQKVGNGLVGEKKALSRYPTPLAKTLTKTPVKTPARYVAPITTPNINDPKYIEQSKNNPVDLSSPSDFLERDIPAPKATTPLNKVMEGIDSTPYQEESNGKTGINLSGKFTEEQKAIADKYSPFFKAPVSFLVSDVITRGNGQKDDNADGLTKFYTDGSRTLDISNQVKGKDFEFAMLHEIGHRTYGYDEDGASEYATSMIKFANEALGIKE